jgi:hypothetical protein
VGDQPSLVIATQDINQLIPQLGIAIGPDGEALYNAGVELLEQVIDLLPWDEPPSDPFLAACRILLTRLHAHLLAGRLLLRGGFVVDATLSARAAVEALWLLDYLNTDKSELRRWLKGEYISAARVRNALSESALRHRIYDELCAQSHPNQTGLLIYTIRPGQVRALAGEQGSVVPYGAMRFYSLLLLLSHALVQCQHWLAESLSLPAKWGHRMLVLDEQIVKYQDRLFRRAGVPPDAEPVLD